MSSMKLRDRAKLKKSVDGNIYTTEEENREYTNNLKSAKKTEVKSRKKTEVKSRKKTDEVIAIDYGTQTPGQVKKRVKINPIVQLERLPTPVIDHIEKGDFIYINQDDYISPLTNRNHLPWRWLAIRFFIVICFSLWISTSLGNLFYSPKNLTASSDLIILPIEYARNEENTEIEIIISKKQEIKRNIFIEQECSSSGEDDFQYDYALKSNGARILSTVDTEPYGENYIKIKFLGVNLGPLPTFIFPQHASDSSGPSALLEGTIVPGNCWAFKGSRGRTRIQLAKTIVIRALAIEHLRGSHNSAPRFFSIMGIDYTDNGDEIRTHLGTFEFEKNGKSTQFFKLTSDESTFPFRIIEFHVTANHGNRDFTCVYRLRVYGQV